LDKLSHLSIETFLSDYWQKRPVVLRQVFPEFNDIISPEELAGLALDDDIDSRLIMNSDRGHWNLKQGPLNEQDFHSLADANWTLLVQSVDHWSQKAENLVKRFDFIPKWRLDDLMVSYATTGGGVGPHIDQYDVFLIQGSGRRHWQVGEKDQAVRELSPHPQLKQVAQFEASIDAVLEIGDVLYIPPNTPHNGVAVDACLTYSVGFRAPSVQSIFEQLLTGLIERDESISPRYQDQVLDDPAQLRSAAIPPHTLPWIKQQLSTIPDQQLIEAFGQLVTFNNHPLVDEFTTAENITNSEILKQTEDNLQSATSFQLKPASRACYQVVDTTILLFVDGNTYQLPADWLVLLEDFCQNKPIDVKNAQNLLQHIDLIETLASINVKGCLLFKQ
jgi:50S ribosomal protein L16 3-hydroxylase